jgi:hypothetical protein
MRGLIVVFWGRIVCRVSSEHVLATIGAGFGAVDCGRSGESFLPL